MKIISKSLEISTQPAANSARCCQRAWWAGANFQICRVKKQLKSDQRLVSWSRVRQTILCDTIKFALCQINFIDNWSFAANRETYDLCCSGVSVVYWSFLPKCTRNFKYYKLSEDPHFQCTSWTTTKKIKIINNRPLWCVLVIKFCALQFSCKRNKQFQK